MRTMCVEITHGFLACTRRFLIRHGQHFIDERGNGPGLLGLFLQRDRENAACGVFAGDTTRRSATASPHRTASLAMFTSDASSSPPDVLIRSLKS